MTRSTVIVNGLAHILHIEVLRTPRKPAVWERSSIGMMRCYRLQLRNLLQRKVNSEWLLSLHLYLNAFRNADAVKNLLKFKPSFRTKKDFIERGMVDGARGAINAEVR